MHNFVIEQGATFRKRLYLKTDGVVVPLTDCTARMQIRPNINSSDVLLALTDGDGTTVDEAGGFIDLYISDDDTAALTFRRGVYDLEIENSSTGDVMRLLQGGVAVSPNVTR